MTLALALASLVIFAAPAPAARRSNVVLIVTDGLRAQEFFTGASPALMGQAGGVEEAAPLAAKYWRETPQERREALMPFLWKRVARDGQVFSSRVTNPERVSYPGYNEMLTGATDRRVGSNDAPANPNVTVFEWLNAQRGFSAQRVQAFATWQTFMRIFNVGRSHLDVRAGWEPPFAHDPIQSPARRVIDAMHRSTTPLFGDNAFDAMTFIALKESLRTTRPRALFLGLGETDEWMHAGRYDLALEAAHRADGYIAELWSYLQSMPEYRGSTTFIITTDHGRGGDQDEQWRSHGASIPGCDEVWVAAMGPRVAPLGSRMAVPVTQSQIASTVAAAVGLDWQAVSPDAASALPLAAGAATVTARR